MSSDDQFLKGNIGEWSEPYVILKLASDGVLRQADENMQPSAESLSKVVRVVREDTWADLNDDGSAVFSHVDEHGDFHEYFVPSGGCADKADRLLKAIKSVIEKDGAFSLPAIDDELKYLGFRELKNPIPKGQKFIKRDVGLKIIDANTGTSPTLGFSIKSELGSPPTLLNASEATNLVYRVSGISDSQMEEINSIDDKKKILNRGKKLHELAKQITFDHYSNQTFMKNLRLIDGDLPQMISDITLAHYLHGKWSVKEVVDDVSKTPRYSDCDPVYCSVKVKRFLRACALGMMPSEPWKDCDDAAGGYVVVLPDGELVAFYIYNRAVFDKYLLDYTRFDHGSMSRHKYMEVYKKDGKYYVKLNLQIRFTR